LFTFTFYLNDAFGLHHSLEPPMLRLGVVEYFDLAHFRGLRYNPLPRCPGKKKGRLFTMAMVTRRVFLASAGTSLIAVPSLSFACDDTEKTNNPYRFSLLPAATMSISVRFNSGWTNAMSFVDVRTGRHFPQWPGCGNRDRVHPNTFEYKNSGTSALPFLFQHGYKATPADDPNMPWCRWAGVVKSDSRQAITIGYTDSTSPDNLNCLITLTITSGELPGGGRG
jgi:hypothetical protein